MTPTIPATNAQSIVYDIDSARLIELLGDPDFEAMLAVGRMLNIVTLTLSAASRILDLQGNGEKERARELARVRRQLCNRALNLVEDLQPVYGRFDFFAGFDDLLGVRWTLGKDEPLRIEECPFRLYSDNELGKEILRSLDLGGREYLPLPTKFRSPAKPKLRPPNYVDETALDVDNLSIQFMASALQFVEGLAQHLNLEKHEPSYRTATTSLN